MASRTKQLTRVQRERELKKVFGPDYRQPTYDELMNAPRVSLKEVLTEAGLKTTISKETLLRTVKEMQKRLAHIEKQLSKK